MLGILNILTPQRRVKRGLPAAQTLSGVFFIGAAPALSSFAEEPITQ